MTEHTYRGPCRGKRGYAEPLSSRERYRTTFRHEEPDRVPLFMNAPQFYFVDDRVQWRDQFERADGLLAMGQDPMIDIWLPDPVCDPEVEIRSWRTIPEEGGEPLMFKEYHTPAGVLRQVVRETSDWCSPLHTPWQPTTFGIEKRTHYGMDLFDDWAISRRTEPWVKGPEDVEKLQYILKLPSGHLLDEWRQDALRAKKFAQERGLLLMVRRTIVGDAFLWLCNGSDFMCAMIESPDYVREFLAVFQAWSLQLIELALDIGVDVIQRRGWYENPDFWGPTHFATYLAPLIEEETQLVHQADTLHCYLLTEGHGHYLDTLSNMSVDILWGIDPVMGQVNLSEIKARLGGTKTLLGGVNSEVTLTQGTEEDIRKSTREVIATLAPGGGFVLSPIGGIWPGIPWRNVEVFFDEWKKWRTYPIREVGS